ncbi:MAG: HAD family phosphatase [Spirochaetaceae bacterium]|jgi:putative hydrolase of the HAD superfamily|nr:HAD family phosphatase [Spirochaetaceae bacterium]
MDIKAVVFDYGKVISFPPEDSALDELAAIAGMSPQALDSLLWPHRAEYDRGTITGKEYYRMLLAAGGVHRDDRALEKMTALDLRSWTHINPGTVKLMEDIRAIPGLKLGILSNMPHEFLALARGTVPVFDLPDRSIFSCEVGYIKPEAAIYRRLLSALGVEPEALVFFDDMQINIDAARSLGIRAFLWKDPETARAELNRLKIPV